VGIKHRKKSNYSFMPAIRGAVDGIVLVTTLSQIGFEIIKIKKGKGEMFWILIKKISKKVKE
jgi:hypothetical protein